MRSFKPLMLTYTAILLLPTLIISALPLDPTQVPFRARALVRNLHLPVPSMDNITMPLIHYRAWFCCAGRCCLTDCCRKTNATANHTALIDIPPPKYSKGMENFLTALNPFLIGFGKPSRDPHLDEAKEEEEKQKKMRSNATSPAADGGGGGGKKEITRRWTVEEEDKDVPLVRIFPNGSFSPFTPEEMIEFYILRNAQGQGPDLRDPPLEHPAPPGVEQTPKPSKEGSVYDESRTCDSSGEWCKMPVEGSQLIAGIGIGSCTYFEPEGMWGKTVTYLAC